MRSATTLRHGFLVLALGLSITACGGASQTTVTVQNDQTDARLVVPPVPLPPPPVPPAEPATQIVTVTCEFYRRHIVELDLLDPINIDAMGTCGSGGSTDSTPVVLRMKT